MNSLDTNVILRYLLDDIPAQTAKAKAVITGSACYVTDVVVTETVFVLERVVGMERTDINALMRAFLELSTLTYNDYFLGQVFDFYIARKPLSFADCYAAAEAKAYDNTLVTFDKALAKHGSAHIKVL